MMRHAILFVVIGAFACAQAKPSPPAEGPQESGVKIKAYTRLVEVPVVVTDRYGRHVTGLTKDDFSLFEDKAEKKIASFDHVVSRSEPIRLPTLPSGYHSNLLTGAAGKRAISVIVMDTVNTSFSDQVQARQQLLKYLAEKVQPGTTLSLIALTRGEAKVIHDYTTDTAVLIRALKRVKGGIFSPSSDQVDARTTMGTDPTNVLVDQETAALEGFMQTLDPDEAFARGVAVIDTMAAMESIAHSLAGIPGRKSLIWATASFPFQFDDTRGFSSADFSGRMARLFETLNDANVAVYPVDVRGLTNFAFIPASRGGSAPSPSAMISANRAFRNTIDTLQTMAEMTGGVAYYNTNDIAGAIGKAADDSSSYYLLGYYLTGRESDQPKWHKIEVKLQRKGLKARARKGLFSYSTRDIQAGKRADLQVAERSPLEFTMLAMVVKWPGYDANAASIPFEVRVETGDVTLSAEENQMDLEFLVVARDAQGRLLDQVSDSVRGEVAKPETFHKIPLNYKNQLKLTAPPATIRFVVRDNHSGKMGSVIVTEASVK